MAPLTACAVYRFGCPRRAARARFSGCRRRPGRRWAWDGPHCLSSAAWPASSASFTTFWPYSGFPEKAPNPQNQLSRCPKTRIKIPETGLLLTQAVKSEGTNGFSAIELPHVMPVGASQHHKTMPEDAHLPRPSHSSMLSVCTLSCLSLPLCGVSPLTCTEGLRN